MTNRVTFFPVRNGDAALIEADGITVLTDLNYSKEDDRYDIAPDLQTACFKAKRDYRLSCFVLTHPDKDHLSGFTDLFWMGDPSEYMKRPKEDDTLILIEEMWVSPYSANPAYETDASAPVFKEIQRRIHLTGDAADLAGNRIRIRHTAAPVTRGTLSANIGWVLLAPTPKEADIKKAKGNEEQPSSNDSSLVIQWTVRVEGGVTRLLLGGDATVEVWDRVWSDFGQARAALKWHILLTPHHCSRGALARKNDEGQYEYSAAALNALGQVEGDGFAVASSKEVKRNDDNPPSWEAKQKYLGILRGVNATNVESRFVNPETYDEGKHSPVVFEFLKTGPVLKVPRTGTASREALGATVTVSPTYG